MLLCILMLIDTHRRRKRREKGREREVEKGVGPGDMRGLVIFSGGGRRGRNFFNEFFPMEFILTVGIHSHD